MRLLYHFCLQPFSREVRVVLREKSLDFTLRDERPGRIGEDLLALHPAGDLPVLVEPDGLALADSRAICVFLQETAPVPDLAEDDQRLLVEAMRYLAQSDPIANRNAIELLSEHVRTRFRMSDSPLS